MNAIKKIQRIVHIAIGFICMLFIIGSFLSPAFAKVLNVPETIQEQNQWCWAAVSKATLSYYGQDISQCTIAEYARTHATWHNYGSVNCCQDASQGCNYWNYNYSYNGSLQKILQNWGVNNSGYAYALTQSVVSIEIDNNRPFIIRWEWSTGGGHFLVGHGIESGMLHYMNPWYGEGLKTASYDWVVSGSTHTWTSTNRLTTNIICTYTLSPANYGFSPSSGTGSIAVTPSSSSCSWTATSNDSWITIASGSSGTGSGTVTYSVAANTTGSARKGTLTVAEQTIIIRQAGSTFWDVPENVFKPYIYSIYVEGITVGFGSGMYCPSNNVTRGQMAAFIIRAKFGETFGYTTTPYYSDVPDTHTFFKYVQKLKDEGITTTTGTYMVDDIVTREQMAAFIIRAKYGETFSHTTVPYYSDVASTSVFYKYVQKLKDDAITTTTGTYMASSNVTRDQMAAFLGRAFLGME